MTGVFQYLSKLMRPGAERQQLHITLLPTQYSEEIPLNPLFLRLLQKAYYLK